MKKVGTFYMLTIEFNKTPIRVETFDSLDDMANKIKEIIYTVYISAILSRLKGTFETPYFKFTNVLGYIIYETLDGVLLESIPATNFKKQISEEFNSWVSCSKDFRLKRPDEWKTKSGIVSTV
jgi:hypothetical protein